VVTINNEYHVVDVQGMSWDACPVSVTMKFELQSFKCMTVVKPDDG